MRRLLELPRTYLVSAALLTLLLSIYLLGSARSAESSSWQAFVDSRGAAMGGSQHNDASLDAIYNETLGFQKIIVINMKSRSDHRDEASLAASLVGLKLDYIDGVTEFNMEKALPVRPEELALQGKEGGGFGEKVYLSWRAHVNAIRMIVEQNLTSALIMEDDADYDYRLKSQAVEFARASRLLLQPVQGTTDQFLDPTKPRKSINDEPYEIDIDHPLRPVTDPTSSPYGDVNRWDLLWMGHCGSRPAGPGAAQHPLGRVIKRNDETVLQTQHYDPGYGDRKVWPSYPNHTRIYFHARAPVCNLAYAISLPGARRLLYQVGIKNMTGTTDTILNKICDGGGGASWRYKKRTCLSVLPTLFQHHRPKAYPRAYTEQIRHGTRANFEKLIDGDYDDLYDAFPNEKDMALYFHHKDSLDRYEKFLEDPKPFREREDRVRGVRAAQELLKAGNLQEQDEEEDILNRVKGHDDDSEDDDDAADDMLDDLEDLPIGGTIGIPDALALDSPLLLDDSDDALS